MWKIMKVFINRIIKIVMALIFWPFKCIVPKGNVIILQTYSSSIYCENTKYLYEYLSEHTDYEVYWVTEHEEIQRYLDSKGYKYITYKRPVEFILIVLRAKIAIDSGSMHFNRFNLIGGKTVKITTMHGNGPKVTIGTYETFEDNLKEIVNFNRFDYVNFSSKYSAWMIGNRHLRLPFHKAIYLGYPRCDQFFDDVFVKERYEKKEIVKQLSNNFNDDGKILLYTPTWRPYKYELPLFMMKEFEVNKFDNFLKENEIFFFYTSHTVNAPKNVLPETDYIRYVTHKKNPFFDINLFMLEVDILLNDYSTTSTDFALLKRPQIFFMPDYEYYNVEKGFIEDYKAILPGKEICSFDEFKNAMIACLKDQKNYLKQHESSRKLLLERYYDVSLTNSCQLFTEFINSLTHIPQ